jgi:hypothetical protein
MIATWQVVLWLIALFVLVVLAGIWTAYLVFFLKTYMNNIKHYQNDEDIQKNKSNQDNDGSKGMCVTPRFDFAPDKPANQTCYNPYSCNGLKLVLLTLFHTKPSKIFPSVVEGAKYIIGKQTNYNEVKSENQPNGNFTIPSLQSFRWLSDLTPFGSPSPLVERGRMKR